MGPYNGEKTRRGEKEDGESISTAEKGIIYAAGAYTMWGILPIYWKWVEEVPADEILAHRIVWAFVFMLIVLGVTKRFRQFIGEFVNLLNDLNY